MNKAENEMIGSKRCRSLIKDLSLIARCGVHMCLKPVVWSLQRISDVVNAVGSMMAHSKWISESEISIVSRGPNID